jgi:hypothetical protein
MTLEELAATLNDLLEAGTDPETEVRLAIQPNYPFEHSVARVEEIEDDNGRKTVYIAERQQEAYLSTQVSEALGWR